MSRLGNASRASTWGTTLLFAWHAPFLKVCEAGNRTRRFPRVAVRCQQKDHLAHRCSCERQVSTRVCFLAGRPPFPLKTHQKGVTSKKTRTLKEGSKNSSRDSGVEVVNRASHCTIAFDGW